MLIIGVTASKLKCYLDVDMVVAILAATGDSVPATGDDSTTASSDAEEVPEDESYLTSAVGAANNSPSRGLS